jgi:PAS domain S-box-containing protein
MSHKEGPAKQTGDPLRHSEARLAGILAIASDAIITIDDRHIITLFSDGAEKIFGYHRDEILGKHLDVLIPERFRRIHGEHIEAFAIAPETSRRMGDRQELYGRHKSGREFPAEASISRLEIGGERIFTVVLRDISERKATEAALRESEQRLWAFLNNSSVIGWMKDHAGRYVFLSGNFQRRFGGRMDNWMGKTDFELWPREFAERFAVSDRKVLEQNRNVESLEQALNADGTRSWWLNHRFPFRDSRGLQFVGGLGVDITARVLAEEALAESNVALEARVAERTKALREEMSRHQEAQESVARLQRMEALGQLTGGVAHDFNNLLTVISGNLQLIGMDITDEGARKYLEEAEQAVEMGARLNQRLMTFAKKRRLAPMAVDLNDQVIGVRELLRRSISESIALTTELGENLWPVRVDPSEIENALVNLAINARDAMPDGGKLLVTTRNITIPGPYAPHGHDLAPGAYVLLSVSDTGVGMTPEVQARAFEPFFSTKAHGKGTGLGLASIYGFVRQSGGFVGIESAVGRGTKVSICLPKLETAGVRVEPVSHAPSPHDAGGETVLVVEDQDAVRRVTLERLRRLGYQVIDAENAPQALQILQGGRHIDLVFSDVVMPGGMSGYELAEQVHATWPKIKVLLASGFVPDAASATGGPAARLKVDILSKPYSQEALAQAVWAALHAEPATTSTANT